MEWWKKTIVYECYPKSFYDDRSQGSGTIRGIIEKLDYLESLGIGALWLTPVYSSPMVDNGYDVADYYQIDPRYGTLEDMDDLIAEAGKHGIRIVMDLVFNHSSDQCEWFRESRQSVNHPKSDWYIWADPKEDGSAPTNWRAIFGGSAWTWCEERKQYYLHSFASAQPDLNWENPQVRRALYDAALFWADRGVGGFRIDAISYIKKPKVFTDGVPDGIDGLIDVNHVYRNMDGILDFLREFRKEVREGRDIFLVGETNSIDPSGLREWAGEDGVFDMAIEFTHTSPEFVYSEKWCEHLDWQLTDLKKNLNAFQYAVNESGWYPVYFENHDKPRCVDHYFGKDADKKQASKLMAVLLMSLRGTPFLYQGQEIGMTNVSWPEIDCYDDISSRVQYQTAITDGHTEAEALEGVHKYSRDNARTPMQWDDTDYAGFSSSSPWLPVNGNCKDINVEKEDLDPDSVLNFYRRLAMLRKEHSALIDGLFRSYENERNDVYIYERTNAEETVRILLNFSDHDVNTDQAYEENTEVLLCSCPVHERGILKPLEALVLKSKAKK